MKKKITPKLGAVAYGNDLLKQMKQVVLLLSWDSNFHILIDPPPIILIDQKVLPVFYNILQLLQETLGWSETRQCNTAYTILHT